MTTKKHANEREMTPQENAANEAHIAAHAAAVRQEKERNELIKERIAAGDIEPGIPPDQFEVTPQASPRRAADGAPTSAEQYGGSRGPTPAATSDAAPASRSRTSKE